jgi:hypothetical protein
MLTAAATVAPSFFISKSRKLSEQIIGHGSHRYRVHQGWGNLDPIKYPVKDCHEMIMDAKGRLIMVGNHTDNNVLIYDKSGKLLDHWGIRYVHGHGLTYWESGGEEYLFISDCARDGTLAGTGSVIKTTLDGRELMILEHPSKYGAYEEDEVWSPTETAIAPNGDIYVADGYGACKVLQYTAEGEYIRTIGEGRGHGDYNFMTAHGVCIDHRTETPTLLITSRAENCFKRYSLEGKHLETIHLPGAYVCRPVIKGDYLYAGVCWSSEILYTTEDHQTHPYHHSPNTGFVTILDKDNKVISNPGGAAPSYKDDKLQTMLQDPELNLFHHCHDVCIDEDENLYICEWNAEGAYPIKLERI